MKKKLVTSFCVICLVSIFLAYVAPTQAAAPAEWRIGLHATMSGRGAMWGTAFTRANLRLIDPINEEGGLLVRGKRYQIKYFKYDNKRDPAVSVENTKHLIFTDKVQAIMHHGGVCVTPTLPTTSEHKIMTMDISVGPQTLRWPYNFNTLPAGRNWSLMALKAMKRQWGIKTVAEINPDNESGYTTEADDKWAAEQVGAQVISRQFFPSDTTDFYPILSKAIAAKADMILIGLGNPGNVALIIKQARELGWKGPMGMTQGSIGAPSSAVKIAGQAAEGFVYCTPCHADPRYLSEAQKESMAYYLKRWGEPFIADFFLGFMQLSPLLQAIQRAGTFDPDEVAKVLETGEFVVQGWKLHYVSTPDTYKGRPRSMVFPFPVQTIKGGKNVLIDLIVPEGVEKVR